MTAVVIGRTAPHASSDRLGVVLSSKDRGWSGLEAEFLCIPAGLTYVPGSSSHRLGIHFGRSVNADCRCEGRRHRRVQSHGDIGVVPAGLDGTWEDDAECSILRLHLSPALFRRIVMELGRNPDKVVFTHNLQLIDVRMEAVAWAIKAELEAGSPSDPLYAESLGVALAVRLVQAEPQSIGIGGGAPQTLSPRQRRLLIEFIEAHLNHPLSLIDLAGIAGLGVSHLKTLFRSTFSMPAHQYVVRRRVERARVLLLSSDMPISQIALEAGFSHQSHMARCMRRVLGVTPGTVARMQH